MTGGGMTRRQFDSLWVGGIVHIDNWPWRVLAIDREWFSLVLAKMPESQYPDDIQWAVHGLDCDYVPTQKPPLGQSFGEEEERI